MNKAIEAALERDQIIDITTIGRKTGQPRRIEIRLYCFEGDMYLSGRPGRKRDWYANLIANPKLTLHLKQGLQVDIPARAVPIIAEGPRREVISRILKKRGWEQALEAWVESSPLVTGHLEVEEEAAHRETQMGLHSRMPVASRSRCTACHGDAGHRHTGSDELTATAYG